MLMESIPKHERPRERALAVGTEHLSDAELLALFIGSGTRGKSALRVAQDLLLAFGSLSGVLNAEPRRLRAMPGIGPARQVLLSAAVELARRHLNQQLSEQPVLTNPETATQFLRLCLNDPRRERFAIVHLSNKHHVLAVATISEGTLTEAAVYPREVVRSVLEHHAAAVILAHNHPSGDPTPSDADRRLTKHLIEALALIDVRVLDHIIVSSGRTFSFAEHGLLQCGGAG